MCRFTLSPGELSIIKISPSSPRVFIRILIICLSFYGIFLILSIITVWNLSKRFTAPIISLTTEIQKIQNGCAYSRIIMDGQDEVAVLNNAFYDMLDTIENMRIQKYELKLQNRDNKLRMLQAQLNPHFMNNALQSLCTMSLKSRSPDLYVLILKLSRMMNYVMDLDHVMIPLKSEVDYAENYLAFQKQRFGEDLHISLEVDSDAMEYNVPKMIIQPVLENYFKHGFIKRTDGYQLRMVICLIDGKLTITIQDNGLAMPFNELEDLKQKLKTDTVINRSEDTHGIGLVNIQSRLNLYYHHKGNISFQNLQPYGFEVKILMEQDEINESYDCR